MYDDVCCLQSAIYLLLGADDVIKELSMVRIGMSTKHVKLLALPVESL